MTALVAMLAAGCERDPLDVPCPAAEAGDLVITELSEEWIEVHNPTGAAIELAGLTIVLQPLIGSDPDRIIVRSAQVTIEPDDYAVFGRAAAEYIDYVYADDFDQDLDDNAQLQLEACGVVVDAVLYRGLPNAGSLSLDGALEPTATGNDLADVNDASSNWCLDGTGTPGERNLTCGQ